MTSRRQRGFTLFELIVVIALVGVLATVALGRFRELQEAAEAAAAEGNVAGLRAALLVRSTELAASNRWQEMARLPRENPFPLLEAPPGNYGGVVDGAGDPGKWYYLPRESAVVYFVRDGSGFVAEDGSRAMRFRLQGLNALGQPAAGQGVAYVSLRAMAVYRWNGRSIR